MRLTVIGNSGTCPIKNGACSCFLLEANNKKIVIDLGNGSLSILQKVLALKDIDAVIISHLHFDHMADLFPLKYALETKAALGENISHVILFAPKMPLWISEDIFLNNVFEIKTIEDCSFFVWQNIKFEFIKVVHLIDSFGVRITDGTKTFAYSSDTGLCNQLKKIADNADLFLCESTFLTKENNQLSHHLSADCAAEVALNSKAKKLILTHFWMDNKPKEYEREAKKIFKNSEASKILKTYDF